MTRKSASVLAAVLALTLASACANLDAIRRFAKTSAATADYPQVVADYTGSLTRVRAYEPEQMHAQLDQLIQRRKEQAPRLLAVQTVLVDYMNALGDIAADKLPDVDNEIAGIGKSLEGAKFIGDGDAQIGKETASAAASIAQVLIRTGLDLWRSCEVSRIVKEVDPHLQVVVAGLREILDKDLRASLDNEREAVRKPFQAWIAAATSANDPDGAPPVARVLLSERLELVDGRSARLDAYLQALDKIGKGHAELAANVDQLDADALKKRLEAYVADIQALRGAIETLAK
jgi:hypothetical protein